MQGLGTTPPLGDLNMDDKFAYPWKSKGASNRGAACPPPANNHRSFQPEVVTEAADEKWKDAMDGRNMRRGPREASAARSTPNYNGNALPPAEEAPLQRDSQVYLRRNELTTIRQNSTLSRKKLHAEARDLLQRTITRFRDRYPSHVAFHESLDTTKWPHWKEYIATHDMSEGIVGDGIIDVRVEEIEGTSDPNRGRSRRVDSVIYNVNVNQWQNVRATHNQYN